MLGIVSERRVQEFGVRQEVEHLVATLRRLVREVRLNQLLQQRTATFHRARQVLLVVTVIHLVERHDCHRHRPQSLPDLLQLLGVIRTKLMTALHESDLQIAFYKLTVQFQLNGKINSAQINTKLITRLIYIVI